MKGINKNKYKEAADCDIHVCMCMVFNGYKLPLSIGDPKVRLLRLELKLYGRGDGGTGVVSSPGRHVSTIASKQFTNNSDDSPIIVY